MNRNILIYHGNCIDGFGAALACWEVNGDTFDYIHGNYNVEPDKYQSDNIIFVDFCYKLPVMQRLLNDGNSVTILDHHISAYNELKDFEHPKLVKLFDMNHSGAVLSYKYFNNITKDSEVPTAYLYIEDRDLWKFKMRHTKEFNMALFSYPYDFKYWDEKLSESVESIINDGAAIKRKFDKDIKEFLSNPDNILYQQIGGIIVPAVNLPYFYASESANIISEGHAFGAAFYETRQGYVYSLRAKETSDVDVSQIAVLYGGGGHKLASGFTVSKSFAHSNFTIGK
jgi:oligoribonuclease NrnB/cAMP/cGMP phosphodiesterase (DHH superfamily)